MDPESWREVRALFDELIELHPDQQAERLAAIGATDPRLRDSVVALLSADSQADEQLGQTDAALLPPPPTSPISALPQDPFGLSGRTVAHFHIVEPLGAGGMGVVYRAEDLRLGRTVALKVPLPGYRLDASTTQRFLHEARSAAALDHPNLCSIYEVGESDEGHPFLAMPLYPGETLKERLAREGPLPVEEVVEIARQVAEGLAAAHAAGIVHRDIKPGNVMLLPQPAPAKADAKVKILDFGLAKVRDFTLTGSRAQLGTVAYMAPEQIRREPADERADLWALGVVLYEVLTGRRPFEGEHEVSIAHAIVHEEPLRPSALRGEIPRALEGLLNTLLRKEPVRRPVSAQQVAAELSALQSGRALPVRRALAQRWAAATGWQRRRVPHMAMGGVAAVLAVVAGAILVMRSPHEPVLQVAPTSGSIAVLPFANLSGDVQQEYLSDGITEELTTHLARVDGLRVAARTSAFRFKGRNADVREVGRALGVATVLHGSLRREGSRVRITAQLLDASNGYHLWSETYDRELSDIFGVQDEISRAIVPALQIRLVHPVAARLPPTASPEAYELYLRGRFFANRRTEDALARAAAYYQQAIAIDPAFARAYAGLADTYVAPRHSAPAERFRRGKVAALQALALDSTLAEAHTTLGWIMMWYDRDWPAAERHLRRAIASDPNYLWAHQWYSAYLSATGQLEEALTAKRRAYQTDPLSVAATTHLGTNLFWMGRYQEAIAEYRKALEVDPDFFMAHWGLSRVYLHLGRHEEALRELRYPGTDYLGFYQPALLGYAHAVAGQEAEARRVLADLHDRSGRGEYVAPTEFAAIHIGLGEIEQALDWLERHEADRGARIFLKLDPIFDPLRGEPRFHRLLRRLRLE